MCFFSRTNDRDPVIQVSKSLVEQQLDWIIVIFNTCKAKFVVDALEYPSHLYYPLEFSTGSLRMVSVGNTQGHNYYYARKEVSQKRSIWLNVTLPLFLRQLLNFY